MYRRRRRFLQRPAPGVRPAPRAAAITSTGLLERISVAAHISSQQEYKERENIENEIQTSLQRSFFNASEFFKISLHESPLPVLSSSLRLFRRKVWRANARACVCVTRYKDREILLSFLLNSEKNKKCREMCSSVALFLLCFFLVCFLIFFLFFFLSFLSLSLSVVLLHCI